MKERRNLATRPLYVEPVKYPDLDELIKKLEAEPYKPEDDGGSDRD